MCLQLNFLRQWNVSTISFLRQWNVSTISFLRQWNVSTTSLFTTQAYQWQRLASIILFWSVGQIGGSLDTVKWI